jgi:hypothetical protein
MNLFKKKKINNDTNSIHQDLWTAEYDNKWDKDTQGKPFLYKLIQRVNRSYNPEDINMNVSFDGIEYPVDNGTIPYTGNLTISNQNYSPSEDFLHLPFKNDLDVELLVNFSYRLKQRNYLISKGSVWMSENTENRWSVTPNLVRTSGNYSVEFEYPDSWINPNVFKNAQNITDDLNVTITPEKIHIANDIITQGVTWNITALSPNINFDADSSTKSYLSSQKVSILGTAPDKIGNLTFILVDPLGLEVTDARDFIEDLGAGSGYIFEYTLPVNAFTGQWTANVIWNNNTDAGLQTVIFQVGSSASSDGGGGDGDSTTVITGVDPQLILNVVLVLIIGSVAGLTTYQAAKRHKRKKQAYRQKIYNKYMDVLNLNYVMVSDKKTGLNVYEQTISGKQLDPTLISGFLEAIRTFGLVNNC